METDACGQLEDVTSDDSEECSWLGKATATNRDYTQTIISSLNVYCSGLDVLMSDRQHQTAIMAVPDIMQLNLE